MRMFEFQAKALLAEAGIPTPHGDVASSPEEAVSIAAGMGGQVVVKAQVLAAGARGKSGGVRFASTPSAAGEAAAKILGSRIRDLPVEAVLVDERLAIARELYVGITLDRFRRCPVAIFCPTGGMEIEEVAAATPDKITKRWIDVAMGLPRYEAMNALLAAGLQGRELTGAAGILERLYRLYYRVDGDPIVGTTSLECLRMFEEDPNTDVVVLVGELGGTMEEDAAEFIPAMTKPVLAFIAGRMAPPGKRMGHAGAIVEGDKGSMESKVRCLESAGARAAWLLSQLVPLLREAVGSQ